VSTSSGDATLSRQLLLSAIRRELAEAQGNLAHAEDRGDPEDIADSRRKADEALQRLRDLTIRNQPCLRYLDRPRAAHVSVESRLDVTEVEREQLRSNLRRILNKEATE
jgi:hypothetical protein